MTKEKLATIEGLTVTKLDSITAFDLEDGGLLFALEELQNATISNTEETQDITGQGGRKLDIIKENKAVSITATNGLISAGLMATQTGGTYEYLDEVDVSYNETITLTDPEVAYTGYSAVGIAGAEIKAVVRESAGGMLDTINQLKQGATAEAGVFTYDPLTRALGFAPDEFQPGDRIRVFYNCVTKGARVDNPTDEYSSNAHIIIDVQVRDRCGKTFHGQFDVPKASVSGNFEVKAGEEQSVHNFEAEALASIGSCDANSTNAKSVFYTFTVFGLDEPQGAPEEEEPVTPPVENPGNEDNTGDDDENKTNTGDEGGNDTPVVVSKDALSAKVTAATEAKANVEISEDGTDLTDGDVYVTQDIMDAFDAAIAAAQGVLDNEDAMQDDVDAAVTTLDGAITAFDAAKVTVEE